MRPSWLAAAAGLLVAVVALAAISSPAGPSEAMLEVRLQVAFL